MNISVTLDSQADFPVITCQFKNSWTWEECREATRIIYRMQALVGEQVRYILDMRQSYVPPEVYVNYLQRFISLVGYLQPVEIIDQDLRLPTTETLFAQMFPYSSQTHFRFVDSGNAALRTPAN